MNKYSVLLLFILFIQFKDIVAHPITQLNYDIKINNQKKSLEIRTKQNLAYFFCKEFLSDFEKYDIEYKRLTSLSNDEFYTEVIGRKEDIISDLTGKLGNIKLGELSLNINLDSRQPQLYLDGVVSEEKLHSVELNCEVVLTGRFNYFALIWKNEDFVISDILKIQINEIDDIAIV